MSEFDREQAHRKSKNLSHLKDEVAQKNTERIERARKDEDSTLRTGPGQCAAQRPQRPRRADPADAEQADRENRRRAEPRTGRAPGQRP